MSTRTPLPTVNERDAENVSSVGSKQLLGGFGFLKEVLDPVAVLGFVENIIKI